MKQKKVNCPKCNEEMEYFGSTFVIKKKKKYKNNFGVCTQHIPYTPVTLINEEVIE